MKRKHEDADDAASWEAAGRRILGPDFRGPLIVLSPCCGLETQLLAWHRLGVEVASHCWDTDWRLRAAIASAHRLAGGSGQIHLGQNQGNFTRQILSELPDADMVSAGPPCPPFSRSGNQLTWDDPRAQPFLSCMLCIIDQASRNKGRFKAFILENVAGMADKLKGSKKSSLDEVLEYLRDSLTPFGFKIWAWRLNASNLGLPQNRDRIYICGRKAAAFLHPQPCLAASDIRLKMACLRSILDPELPSNRQNLSGKQAQNLAWYDQALLKIRKRKQLPEDAVCCFDLSRSPGEVRKPVYRSDGRIMCLTASNAYIWVKAFKAPHFDRFLSGRERLLLQGLDVALAGSLEDSQSLMVCATGNAMAMPCIGVACACLWSGFNTSGTS